MPKIMLNSVEYTGGGGDSGIELTYDEYLALSEAEKTNGTNYYIYDINGDGQEFQPIVYSTDEREIGVWTDGKPLYQKTITLTPTSSIVAIQHDIANVDLIVDIKGVGVRSDYGVVPANCARSSNLVGVWADRTNVGFSIGNTDYVNAPFILTLQYTKTTDSPGSGTWTPQGVPACHYSTSEQVVGTWIDGSTIYEKTFHLSSAQTGDTVIPHGITNPGMLISAKGSAYAGTSLNWLNIPTASTSSTYMLNLYGFDATNIHLEVGSAYSGSAALHDTYVTIQYTKSTT